ncbi:hypothetical protein [Microlunatus sp. Y2014]|uniref:hypothetical protein n=1 Tax=Microlunatus sp. Y2014 TaxID=3418488 RepID=UPI003DA70054
MKRCAAVVFAIAVMLPLGLTTAPAEAGTCRTWQYRVTQKAGVYDRTLEGIMYRVGTAYRGYYLNATDPTRGGDLPGGGIVIGWYAGGTVYNAQKERLGGGVYIPKEKLDYITCW